MLGRSNAVIQFQLISSLLSFDRIETEIIMTYYEEKEKQSNADQLQLIKQTLFEENEKIKRFKEALKEKLLVYQERIQFLKVGIRLLVSAMKKSRCSGQDAECCSAVEIQQLSSHLLDSIQTDGDQ